MKNKDIKLVLKEMATVFIKSLILKDIASVHPIKVSGCVAVKVQST